MHAITADDVEYVKRVVLSLPVSLALGTDDAIGEGLVGLCRAAHSYDGRGNFLGYANGRIVGSVRDAARRADHLSRAHRDRVKNGTAPDAPAPTHFEDLFEFDWEGALGAAESDLALRLTLDDAICSIEGARGAALRLSLEDVKQIEIAKVLGVHESRVSQLLRDARGELLELLGASSAAELLG